MAFVHIAQMETIFQIKNIPA